MKIRRMTDGDLAEVKPWFREAREGFLDDWLSHENTGFVAYDAKGPTACAFLLLTNSKLAFMEYMRTNPRCTEMEQGKGLLTLAFGLEHLSKEMGYKVILGLVPEDHFSLAKFYERQKAQKSGKLLRLYYKAL